MSDDYRPDVKIAETYVRHGEQEFQVYTFERGSSAAADYGTRFHETHVYAWDRKERKRGEWLHQLYGHGIAFHNAVVESYAESGTFDEEEHRSIYQKTQAILAEAKRKALADVAPHYHVAGDASAIDKCKQCGRDIRDGVHFRVDDPRNPANRNAVTT